MNTSQLQCCVDCDPVLKKHVLGVFAALSGGLVGALLQNPIVLSVVAAILVLFATSLFGFWELRLPTGLTQAASKNYAGYFGSLFMGLTLGVIAAPCIGPFVLGLLTWVARTADLASLTSLSPEPLGSVKHLSRGSYQWRMCYQDDGSLVAGGLIPLIIQWEREEHPTASMADSGCSLAALRGRHPDPDRVRLTLDAIGLSEEIEVEASGRVRESGLEAEIRCPLGRAIFD